MTAPLRGWTGRLTAGMAQWLADREVGTWTPDGPFPVPGPLAPIAVQDMPASPDRVIVLTPYTVTDLPGRTDVVQGLQVRCRGSRGDTRDAEDLQDLVYDALHGATHFDVADGIHISQAWRQSAVLLGRDDTTRWETAGNYYLQTARSTPNTLD